MKKIIILVLVVVSFGCDLQNKTYIDYRYNESIKGLWYLYDSVNNVNIPYNFVENGDYVIIRSSMIKYEIVEDIIYFDYDEEIKGNVEFARIIDITDSELILHHYYLDCEFTLHR